MRRRSQRRSRVFLFPVAFVCLSTFLAGCGTIGNEYPPAFNIAKGEGKLVGSKLVLSYPTGSSSKQAGLDTFYNQTICPNSLTTAQCDTNRANLDTAQFGNFDLDSDPIANNSLGIKAVDAVKVDYIAMNVDHSPVTVSGGLLIPKVAPASIKGMILYFHGTTVQRTSVPSNFAAPGHYVESPLAAAVWASQGYVVAMPDYIGLGDDTTHPHPYVIYPAENAQSGLAMVRAVRSVLSGSYSITATLPLFITGYSEGGAYSLEAAHLMQSNPSYGLEMNAQLRMAAPLSGVFDLSGTTLSYLLDNIDPNNDQWFSFNPIEAIASRTLFSTYMMLGFSHYSGIAPSSLFAESFYNCSAHTANCVGNLYDVYFTNPQSVDPPYEAIVQDVTIDQAAATGWAITNNSIGLLLTPAYTNALMQKDAGNPLYQQMVRADTYPFIPRFPVALLSLEKDSLVTRKNSDTAYAYFTKKNPKGPYQEILIPNSDFFAASFGGGVGEVDHPTEFPFMSVLILNQFNMAK